MRAFLISIIATIVLSIAISVLFKVWIYFVSSLLLSLNLIFNLLD